MKIGFQIMFEDAGLEDIIANAKREGFNCIEINLTDPNFYPDRIKKENYNAIKNSDIDILLHAPNTLSFFFFEKHYVNASIEIMKEIIDFADELKIKVITMHIGDSCTISYLGKIQKLHDFFPDEFKNIVYDALCEVFVYAKDKSPYLSIENAGAVKTDLGKEIVEKILNEFKPAKLTWDWGHTNLRKNKEREREEKFFEKHLDRVIEVHLHDNKGDYDEHNVVGKGNVNFRKYLKIMETHDPYYIFEIRPADRVRESYKNFMKIKGGKDVYAYTLFDSRL